MYQSQSRTTYTVEPHRGENHHVTVQHIQALPPDEPERVTISAMGRSGDVESITITVEEAYELRAILDVVNDRSTAGRV
jgi:hypothetical protein